MRFDGKVAVITGAGRGLGAAHARLLASRGAAVVVNDFGVDVRSGDERPDPAADVVAEITEAGGRAVADRHDVVADGGAIVERAIDAFGSLDIVINNAGFAAGGPFAELPVDVFDRACDVHIKGTRAVLRAAWPHLVRSGKGRVINTASSAVFGAPGISPYATGKGAVFAFTRAVAHEGTPHGITVNAIMPIAITRLTAMLPEGRRKPLEAHYPPERIAPVVAWLAHETTTITGECFAVGGGRAARVFLAETAGACLPDDAGPEDWAAHTDQIFAMDGFGTPDSMYRSAAFSAEVLGLGPSGYDD